MTRAPDDGTDYEAQGVRAQELARSGKLAEAEAIVEALPAGDDFSEWLHEKVSALIAIAGGLADRGLTDRALQMAREAERVSRPLGAGGTWQQADALADVGAMMIRIGARDEGVDTWARAVGLARQHQERDEECGKILLQISTGLSDIGLWERATAVAESIRLERLRLKALNEIQNRRRGYQDRGLPE